MFMRKLALSAAWLALSIPAVGARAQDINLRVADSFPIGHYAVQPHFSDGHDSGIFTWQYLYRLGAEQEALWARYEQRLAEAGLDRDAPMQAKAGSACGSH